MNEKLNKTKISTIDTMKKIIMMRIRLLKVDSSFIFLHLAFLIGYYFYSHGNGLVDMDKVFITGMLMGAFLFVIQRGVFENVLDYKMQKQLFSLPITMKDYVSTLYFMFVIVLILSTGGSLVIINLLNIIFKREVYLPSIEIIKFTSYYSLIVGVVIFFLSSIFSYESQLKLNMLLVVVMMPIIRSGHGRLLEGAMNLDINLMFVILIFIVSYFISLFLLNHKDIS